MISLTVVFWVMVFFFGLIGFMRGWTKEIVAMAGLVLSLFTINQFGTRLVSLWQSTFANTNPLNINDPLFGLKQQFYVLSLFHLILAFFSYQGTPLATQISGGRLGSRVRAGLQERLLGFVVGSINGYLIVGALWSFLEYRLTPDGFIQIGPTYAFDPTITRPVVTPTLELLLTHLPLPFLAPFLAVAMVGLFIFVIIVII